MRVTNLMEEFAKAQVDDMYDRIKRESKVSFVCGCENCRMDTLCYVLNRIPPKYIVSGRGASHAKRELETFKQISADVDTVIMDGIRLVSSSKRPNHGSSYLSAASETSESCSYFFFPIISGAVYDGTTFEPLAGAKVSLFLGKSLAQMSDSTWQNPCFTFKATDGAYNFFVRPERALEKGQSRSFDFKLEIQAEGYDGASYAFSIPLLSKGASSERGFSSYSLKVQDMILFPQGTENPMERYVKSLEEG